MLQPKLIEAERELLVSHSLFEIRNGILMNAATRPLLANLQSFVASPEILAVQVSDLRQDKFF